jgi:RNA polymerase subunit RPABC4/transcription elongation factor Spt4
MEESKPRRLGIAECPKCQGAGCTQCWNHGQVYIYDRNQYEAAKKNGILRVDYAKGIFPEDYDRVETTIMRDRALESHISAVRFPRKHTK